MSESVLPGMPSRILLIGYRGTGKTSVAKLLAAALDFEWVDADEEVEARAGKSIANIFEDAGETAFRELERVVVADLCTRSRAVLSLGGGAVLDPANRNAICTTGGVVVWLTARPQTIHARIECDTTTSDRRPNLTTSGGLDEIERLLRVRLPLYRQCATLEIDTEGKSPPEVAQQILARLPTV